MERDVAHLAIEMYFDNTEKPTLGECLTCGAIAYEKEAWAETEIARKGMAGHCVLDGEGLTDTVRIAKCAALAKKAGVRKDNGNLEFIFPDGSTAACNTDGTELRVTGNAKKGDDGIIQGISEAIDRFLKEKNNDE